jgi:peptidoglycan hydrolase-like protein with peptidoglycan-binding domain
LFKIISTAGRSRVVRATAAAVAAGSFALVAVAGTPGSASAATPHCNDESYSKSTSGDFNVYLPVYRSGSTVTRICALTEGDTGDGVRSLQEAFVQCYGSSIAVDGQFGAATEIELIIAQGEGGVATDGEYGSNTRKAMKWPRADDNPADRECGRAS